MRTPSMYLKDAFWYLSLQSREPRTERYLLSVILSYLLLRISTICASFTLLSSLGWVILSLPLFLHVSYLAPHKGWPFYCTLPIFRRAQCSARSQVPDSGVCFRLIVLIVNHTAQSVRSHCIVISTISGSLFASVRAFALVSLSTSPHIQVDSPAFHVTFEKTQGRSCHLTHHQAHYGTQDEAINHRRQ
jgi:hypothetical protein